MPTLVDTGPLVALIDAGEPDHQRCSASLARISAPLLTTWPVFTEAMYLLAVAGGWPAQQALWAMTERGALHLLDLDESARRRARQLMEQYRDTPMSLADASLVALAEAQRVPAILTLDSDFWVYRVRGREALELLP